ncbi:hypothetical protein DL96DRAFT_1820233 [Flagelloscypha sp. PMI_526]|nr:hypothetical protein DL96DRAFT_1820233 [Flagelloscypha sp. PMI_526]
MPSNVESVRTVYDQLAQDTGNTVDAMNKYSGFADSFKCTTYPPSAGVPDMDKTAYIAYFEQFTKMSVSRKMTLDEIIDAGNKVIAHGTTWFTLHDGTEVVLSHMNIFTFDDGGKLIHIKQFTDSHNVLQLREKFKPQA